MNRSDCSDPDDASLCPDETEDQETPPAAKRWRLDPARLPLRLELEMPEMLLQRLQLLSERSGRDLDEIVISLLDRQLSDLGSEGPPAIGDDERPAED